MNKSDLKDGMVVEDREGNRRFVSNNCLLGINKWWDLTQYNNDLTWNSTIKPNNMLNPLDIMKVYEADSLPLNYLLSDALLDLLWEREKEVDWSKVPKDTKVLVGYFPRPGEKRYFAEYKNGKFYTYGNGQTSWSKDDCELVEWKYCKLAEEPKEEVTFDDIDKKNPFLLYNS